MRNSKGWIAAGGAVMGAALTIGAAALVSSAQAQQQPPPGGGFGGGGFGGGQRPPGGGFGGGFMGGAQMTATDKYLYILRGNTVYQLDATNLKMLNQTELPRPERRGNGPTPPPP